MRRPLRDIPIDFETAFEISKAILLEFGYSGHFRLEYSGRRTKRRLGAAWGSRKIRLSHRGANWETLIHELSHILISNRAQRSMEQTIYLTPHGVEFKMMKAQIEAFIESNFGYEIDWCEARWGRDWPHFLPQAAEVEIQ